MEGSPMNYVDTETKHIRELLFSIIGETTAKTYFSYYGIFQNGLMLGLYKDQKFYLKLADVDVQVALTTQGVERLIDPNLIGAEKYFYLSPSIISNLSDYIHWFQNSLRHIQTHKETIYSAKKGQIRSLPNMNYQLERKLRKINIHSIEQLKEKGEINAFIELIKIGEDATDMTLFKLHGAIHHQLIYTLSPITKQALLNEADDALYSQGFRKLFNSKIKQI